MITIKRGPLVITRQMNDFKTFTDTADGFYFKFSDDVEIILPIPGCSASTKMTVMTALRMNATNYEIDLDNLRNPVSVKS